MGMARSGEEKEDVLVRRKGRKERHQHAPRHQHLCIVYLTEWRTRENESKIEKGDRSRKLCRVLGPSAYQFPCSWQEIGSLTTVGQRRLLSQSYSVLDGFNLEQLVDDEPIHMVFKSLSISSAINLQDSLHLSSTVTDSSEQISWNTPRCKKKHAL